MSISNPHTLEQALERILAIDTPVLRVAMPLGIGKPNPLINLLYRHFCKKDARQHEIYTALSLLLPKPANDLEKRFMQPLVQRLYGNYPDLEYARDALDNKLPDNVRVFEFFLKSGDWLNNAAAQQNTICSNYTHIARDMAARKPHVVMQALAARRDKGSTRLSLSCNPDTSFCLREALDKKNERCLFVGVINNELPFMPGGAEVADDFFDIVVDDPLAHHTLFCTPNSKVSKIDYAIGLHASALVRDGGTLQIGIGSLGDAIAQCLLTRHLHNDRYCAMLKNLNSSQLTATSTFEQGLYACSEMFVNGLLELFKAGIIRREVIGKDGRPVSLHGGFFIGPNQFYDTLRNLPEASLEKIDMQRIDFINQLYGDETLKRQHRKDAVFINTCMMVTLNGAAVSDALEDGRVVSGIGGQYNFVAMAHELEDARSVLLLRATRSHKGEVSSNIVTHYGHCSIPKHLRDIVITEYGIADLRGKSDSETIKALINIADSRFQQGLIDWAVEHGKLEKGYQPDLACRQNYPETVWQAIAPGRDLLPAYPFGHDFTDDELRIIDTLRKLQHAKENPTELLHLFSQALAGEKAPESVISRMGYDNEDKLSLAQRLIKKLFLGNL